MKAAELSAFGVPADVVECIDISDPDPPGTDQVLVTIDAAPINPAELLLIEGRYGTRPELPTLLGLEGVGTVVAVGDRVRHLSRGDRVMNLGMQNWAEQVVVDASQAIKLPDGIDLQQASMLKVIPATAYLMLTTYVDLSTDDWLIQNAANSGVGGCLIRLAKSKGIRTVNVVRREALIAPLQEQGADVVVVDGDDLAERVREATGGVPIKLAIDAVAGTATQRLAACLAEGGVVVNYGLLSGEGCRLGPDQLVFRDISLSGFWLARVLGGMTTEALGDLYATLIQLLVDKTLHIPVEAAYPLEDLKQALAHAAREGRGGKILLAPNASRS